MRINFRLVASISSAGRDGAEDPSSRGGTASEASPCTVQCTYVARASSPGPVSNWQHSVRERQRVGLGGGCICKSLGRPIWRVLMDTDAATANSIHNIGHRFALERYLLENLQTRLPACRCDGKTPSPRCLDASDMRYTACVTLRALAQCTSPSTAATACALRCLFRRLRALLLHAARHWHVGLGSDVRSCSSRWLRVTQ